MGKHRIAFITGKKSIIQYYSKRYKHFFSMSGWHHLLCATTKDMSFELSHFNKTRPYKELYIYMYM